MGLEDDVAAHLRQSQEEDSQRRAEDRARADKLSAMADRAQEEVKEAARILSDRGVPTIDLWSESKPKGGTFTRQRMVQAGQRLGRGWLLRGATGEMFPWALSTNGELFPCHPSHLGTLDEGWCQAGGPWEFTLTADGAGVVMELPGAELRDGWQRGIRFECRPFLADSVAYLLRQVPPTNVPSN